ncbi:MAG: rubredoxin [Proteobacteria bacterium]|nr:rubredoxin [Pseudomonadota bacterium]
MKKYECEPCGWVYIPEIGDPSGEIVQGTRFEDLPPDWVCPVCGAGSDSFALLEE